MLASDQCSFRVSILNMLGESLAAIGNAEEAEQVFTLALVEVS